MKLLSLLISCLILNSCASIGIYPDGVPYMKRDRNNTYTKDIGYYDNHINKNIYSVGFQGNGKNTAQDVRNKFIKRSRELASEKGFQGFCILKDGPRNKEIMAMGAGVGANATWKGHQGDVKLTNTLNGDMCFESK